MISPAQPDFGALMRQFLDGLPEGGLVMCHPGFVDETLISLDPLTTQREHEHAFLAGERFPARCWPRTMLHWPDIASGKPAGRFVAYRNLIRPPTTCDTKPAYIFQRASIPIRREGEGHDTARTPID